jgi:hypothetical protein
MAGAWSSPGPGRKARARAQTKMLVCLVFFLAALIVYRRRSVHASQQAALLLACQQSATAGPTQFAQELLLLQPNGTGPQCRIESFRAEEDLPGCMDEYSHPFSGCFSATREADTFRAFLSGQPVSDLRCGFLGAAPQRWLADTSARFSHCTYAVLTVSFSYGTIKPTSHVHGAQQGMCFVAFVDQAIWSNLKAEPAWNGTHMMRWEVVLVDPAMFSSTIARSSHLIKLLAPRMFPAARYSMYVDRKVKLPRDPLSVIGLVEALNAPHAVATFEHPLRHDVFEEMLADLWHLGKRRVFMRSTTLGESYMKGIKGRDFHDIFRLYMYYSQMGFPMHATGMLDSMLLIWNHQNPCAAALACMWHNQVAYLSMREQLSFNYVTAMLRLTQQVFLLAPFTYNFSVPVSIQPANWAAVGEYSRDSLW